MIRFLVRLLINAAALWAAVSMVQGITFTGGFLRLLAVALVFGVVNSILRPLIRLFAFPLLLLSLGLLTFVLNGLMLFVTAAVSERLALGFHVAGLWPAVVGAFVVSLTSFLLHLILPGPKKG
jgi:putative membrane protein